MSAYQQKLGPGASKTLGSSLRWSEEAGPVQSFPKDILNTSAHEIMASDTIAHPMLLRYTPVTRNFRATHPEIRARIDLAETCRPG